MRYYRRPLWKYVLWKEQRYETKLPGRHQVSNAVTALAASEYLFRKDYEKNNARKAIAEELDEMNVKSAQQEELSARVGRED